MNIEQAKTEIKRTAAIYLMKDNYGNYRLAPKNQRPVYLIGAPGIGKTAAASQAAQEMGLPLVSYTMTHHTRQSAVGLPVIRHKTYDGQEFDVSFYTLSEIIASVYEKMEETGQKEGILFLDEINCVSETLAPAMLQFLQYKTFGNHALPEGWIIVAAGNPQIFNRSARSFDIATLDRLKILHVESDFQAWKEYAVSMQIHPAVLSYLELHPDDLFHVESSVDEKVYVTPRGWEDLSRAMVLYEENHFPVDETLIRQYLHDEDIVNGFETYLILYDKYSENYPVREILRGNISKEAGQKMKEAGWDEKISITSLMLSDLCNAMHAEQICENSLKQLRDPLRSLKNSPDFISDLNQLVQTSEPTYKQDRRVPASLRNETAACSIAFLKENRKADDYVQLQTAYSEAVNKMNEQIQQIESELHYCLAFLHDNGGEQILVSAIARFSADETAASFISGHGCDDYYRYSEALSLPKRKEELQQEINAYRNDK